MPIAIETSIDDEFTSGEQPKMIHGNRLITEIPSLSEVAEEEQEFSKAGFEHEHTKESRRTRR